MKIDIEKLIEIIVREVIAELSKLGEVIDFSSKELKADCSCTTIKQNKQRKTIDLSNYKTPLLTENHLVSLDPAIAEIVVPKGTIISPGAKDIIKKHKLILSNN
ncbi:MAG: hypothetical protein ACYC6P_14815 [Ignavibacteriaceae bacterium]